MAVPHVAPWMAPAVAIVTSVGLLSNLNDGGSALPHCRRPACPRALPRGGLVPVNVRERPGSHTGTLGWTLKKATRVGSRRAAESDEETSLEPALGRSQSLLRIHGCPRGGTPRRSRGPAMLWRPMGDYRPETKQRVSIPGSGRRSRAGSVQSVQNSESPELSLVLTRAARFPV